MLVPSQITKGEHNLRVAFANSILSSSWTMLLYPLLSKDSGYFEADAPAAMLRKLWLMDSTRLKGTLWKNMPDNVLECWKKIRDEVIAIPTVIFERKDGFSVAVQKLDFLREPNSVQAVMKASNFLMTEMPTFFFTEPELVDEPNEILAGVLRAAHEGTTPSVVKLGDNQFIISK